MFAHKNDVNKSCVLFRKVVSLYKILNLVTEWCKHCSDFRYSDISYKIVKGIEWNGGAHTVIIRMIVC